MDSDSVLTSFIEMLVERLSNVERDVKAVRDDRIEEALKKGGASKTLIGQTYDIKVYFKRMRETAHCKYMLMHLKTQGGIQDEIIRQNMGEAVEIVKKTFSDEKHQERVIQHLKNITSQNDDEEVESSIMRNIRVKDSLVNVIDVIITQLLKRKSSHINCYSREYCSNDVIVLYHYDEDVRIDQAVQEVCDIFESLCGEKWNSHYKPTLVEVLTLDRLSPFKVLRAIMRYAQFDNGVTEEDRKKVTELIRPEPRNGLSDKKLWSILWKSVEELIHDETEWFSFEGWIGVFVSPQWARVQGYIV